VTRAGRRTLAALATVAILGFVAGCGAAESRDRRVGYAPDETATGWSWAAFEPTDDGSRVEVAAVPASSGRRPIALARVERGGLTDPPRSDLEALALGAVGEGRGLEPRGVTFTAIWGWGRIGTDQRVVTIAGLRRIAGRLGAPELVIARFEGRGAARRLVATLHDTASGRELARYGPGEPSLAIAAKALEGARATPPPKGTSSP
jgi:hypothetical protein